MKQWFGIEGVKVEMDVPEEIIKQLGVVKGQLRFSTMKTQTVTAVKVTMIETYKRGRKDDKRIDDYQIGTVYLQEPFEIKAEGVWQHEAKVKANKDKTAVAAQAAWTAVAEGASSPAWMERTIAASSWETASSWLPTRDGPNCDGEAWECDQSIGWPYDQPGSDLNWSRSKWHGKCSKNWKR